MTNIAPEPRARAATRGAGLAPATAARTSGQVMMSARTTKATPRTATTRPTYRSRRRIGSAESRRRVAPRHPRGVGVAPDPEEPVGEPVPVPGDVPAEFLGRLAPEQVAVPPRALLRELPPQVPVEDLDVAPVHGSGRRLVRAVDHRSRQPEIVAIGSVRVGEVPERDSRLLRLPDLVDGDLAVDHATSVGHAPDELVALLAAVDNEADADLGAQSAGQPSIADHGQEV